MSYMALSGTLDSQKCNKIVTLSKCDIKVSLGKHEYNVSGGW